MSGFIRTLLWDMKLFNNRYGYCKNYKKMVKAGQTRTRERKDCTRAGKDSSLLAKSSERKMIRLYLDLGNGIDSDMRGGEKEHAGVDRDGGGNGGPAVGGVPIADADAPVTAQARKHKRAAEADAGGVTSAADLSAVPKVIPVRAKKAAGDAGARPRACTNETQVNQRAPRRRHRREAGGGVGSAVVVLAEVLCEPIASADGSARTTDRANGWRGNRVPYRHQGYTRPGDTRRNWHRPTVLLGGQRGMVGRDKASRCSERRPHADTDEGSDWMELGCVRSDGCRTAESVQNPLAETVRCRHDSIRSQRRVQVEQWRERSRDGSAAGWARQRMTAQSHEEPDKENKAGTESRPVAAGESPGTTPPPVPDFNVMLNRADGGRKKASALTHNARLRYWDRWSGANAGEKKPAARGTAESKCRSLDRRRDTLGRWAPMSEFSSTGHAWRRFDTGGHPRQVRIAVRAAERCGRREHMTSVRGYASNGKAGNAGDGGTTASTRRHGDRPSMVCESRGVGNGQARRGSAPSGKNTWGPDATQSMPTRAGLDAGCGKTKLPGGDTREPGLPESSTGAS
ncbi:hypothetical protein Tco_0505064 [Tanacetum coccineum]